MSELHSPTDIIALLQDIELRSQQSVAALSDQDALHGSWTAIDFRIAEERFLIPLSETNEIFPVPKQITLVPKSKSWVFGIANLRGELLPLFDLKHFLYGQATKVNKRSRIMVINHPDLYSGILIDEVFGLRHFQQEPENINSSSDKVILPYLDGSITQQDTHWDVFSFNKLANEQRFLNAAV